MSQASPGPGGNVTGINFFNAELTAKRLEIAARRWCPKPSELAVLVNPLASRDRDDIARDVEAAAGATRAANRSPQRHHRA